MRKLPGYLGVTLVALALGPAPAPAQEKVEVKVVPYAGLADAVKALRSKVVFVDVWATW